MLSERLLKIAAEIDKGSTVADIGSDHGLLAKYLIESGISPFVILTDISLGALKKAESCLNAAGIIAEGARASDRAELRLGDGLSVISEGEADIAVIAGMGGRLMVKLLSSRFAVATSFKRLILQPRNGQAAIREWLYINGFSSEGELCAREGKRICEIIVTRPPERAACEARPVDLSRGAKRPIEFEIPEGLVRENAELGQELVRSRMELNSEIRRSIGDNSARDAAERLRLLDSEDEYLISLLRERKEA